MVPKPSASSKKHASKKVLHLDMAAVSITEDTKTSVVTTDPKTTSTSSTGSAAESASISNIPTDSLDASAMNNSDKSTLTTNAGGHGAERGLDCVGSKKKNQRRRPASKKKYKDNGLFLDTTITLQNPIFTSASTSTSIFTSTSTSTSKELDTAQQSTDRGAKLVKLPAYLEIEKGIQVITSLEDLKTSARDVHARDLNNAHSGLRELLQKPVSMDDDRAASELKDAALHPPVLKGVKCHNEHFLKMTNESNCNADKCDKTSGGDDNGNIGPIPVMQSMRQQASLIVTDVAMEDPVLAEATDISFLKRSLTSVESKAYNNPWIAASEAAVTDAIECLTRNKDMERSYASILSVINVLNRKKGVPEDDSSARRDTENAPTSRMAMDRECSTLLKIMTRGTITHVFSKEVKRQGDISPNSLYLKLYSAMQNAGIQLQDSDHRRACQFLFDQHNTEDALGCLNRIDPLRWNSITYRAAISCHLFSKPRHLYEAEVLLSRYIAHNRASYQHLPMDKSRSASAHQPLADQDEEQAKRAMIKKWFKLQIDSSHWEEIKARYEWQRTSLLDTPKDIGQSPISPLVGDHKLLWNQEMRRDRVSDQEQRSPAGNNEVEIPHSLREAPEQSATTRRGLSFLSVFNFSKTRDTLPAKQTVRTTPCFIRISQPLSTGLTSPQDRRQLTILHNSMLEECVNHKQFEYGWNQVYERMDPALEDRNTAKVAMRLCKRAFLGHGGLEPHFPASPSAPARDIRFKVYYHEDIVDGRVNESQSDGGANDLDGRVGSGQIGNNSKTQPLCQAKQGDPEIWEARAWAIYNKAMMNPFFFTSAYSPSGSPTQSSHPSGGHTTNLYHQYRHGNAFSAAGDKSANGTKTTSPTNVTMGMGALTVFLHDILTVAINSPERSSRYLKAFKIYDRMRNDPQNQYQSQLRDPFVMTCIIKIIYDTVLTAAKTSGHQRERTSTIITSNSLDKPAMTIGPLMDLAFEIYADMRNVGPIRDLPRLPALAPSTPIYKTPTTLAPTGAVPLNSDAAGNLTNENSNDVAASVRIIPPVQHQYYAGNDHKVILQALNPTLQPNLHTRRLPNELYLALLHLCIQVPLSGLEQSSRVVKAIVTDMMSTSPPGQQPANLDRHLAAALQVYHDRWMCRPKKLKERDPYDPRYPGHCDVDDGELGNKREGENESRGCSWKNMRIGDGGCVFHGWMYQPEEYVLEHMTSSTESSSISTPTDELCNITEHTSFTAVKNAERPSTSSSSSCTRNSLLGENSCTLANADENESPHYGISRHDADLDELDQYLLERAFLADTESTSGNPNTGHNRWMDGLDRDTCNNRFYWNLWSREDPELQKIRFSRRRARMLWRHVGNFEMQYQISQ
ncbi:hypothetical protein BGZ50_008405 [Haplosporangium sp. Z 11]|nr:hypothetical protein BGZ50_008405 [Haplosporangium sp. Z 11]